MLHNIIQEKKNKWLQSDDCTISDLIKYIRDKGQLRDTQIEAIETYLFLKIQGQNKPLWQLFSEGFFNNGVDIGQYNVFYPAAVNFLAVNKEAIDKVKYSKCQCRRTHCRHVTGRKELLDAHEHTDSDCYSIKPQGF